MKDSISKIVIEIISNAKEPMGTREIEKEVSDKVKGATRAKIIYRLMILRGEGNICGKNLISGEGKGIWVWWKSDAFV